ncbi:hypothetical protein GCM10010400_24640 [Streptomyces aculeolatus]
MYGGDLDGDGVGDEDADGPEGPDGAQDPGPALLPGHVRGDRGGRAAGGAYLRGRGLRPPAVDVGDDDGGAGGGELAGRGRADAAAAPVTTAARSGKRAVSGSCTAPAAVTRSRSGC